MTSDFSARAASRKPRVRHQLGGAMAVMSDRLSGAIPFNGVVTPTWIGAARGLEGVLTSGRGGGSPRPERFVS